MAPLQTVLAQVTDKKRYGMRVLYWILAWMVIAASLLWITEQFAIAIAGLLIAFLPPVLFERNFKKGLITQVKINFYPDSMTIDSPAANGESINENHFIYRDLSMVRATVSAKTSYSVLRFYSKTGAQTKFRFDNYSDEEKTIAYLVSQQVEAYNKGAKEEEMVILKNS